MAGVSYNWKFRQAQAYRLLRKHGPLSCKEIAAELRMTMDAAVQVLIRGRDKGCFLLTGHSVKARWSVVPGSRSPKYLYTERSLSNLRHVTRPRPVPATELERTWGWGA